MPLKIEPHKAFIRACSLASGLYVSIHLALAISKSIFPPRCNSRFGIVGRFVILHGSLAMLRSHSLRFPDHTDEGVAGSHSRGLLVLHRLAYVLIGSCTRLQAFAPLAHQRSGGIASSQWDLELSPLAVKRPSHKFRTQRHSNHGGRLLQHKHGHEHVDERLPV